MKVYVTVVVGMMFLCTAGVTYGVELIETDSLITMSNNWMHVEITKAAGDIPALGIKTIRNVVSQGMTIQFAFQDTGDFEYYQIDHGTVDSVSTFDSVSCVGAHFFIDFDDSTYIAHVVYTLYGQEFRWDVELMMPGEGVRGAKIDFVLPVVYAMDHVFWTTDGAPFELGGSSLTSCDVVYRNKCVLPAFIFYNDISNIGVSFVSPFDMKKPGLSYRLDVNQSEDPFRISNYYLRLGGVDTVNIARASVYFVPHDGCWRPGIAWMYGTYNEYFNPVCLSLLDGEGWYYQSHPTIKDATMADAAARGVTWEQWHGYFPFYGYYAPDGIEGWSLISNQNTVSFDDWLANPVIPGYTYNSYDTNNIKIAWWDDHNVQSYIYYQPCEAWIPFAEYQEGFMYRGKSYNFISSIARRKDTIPHGAWKYCRLLNPDTSGDWGQFSISQLKYLLERHPDVHGIFLDRDDYWNYDYAHNDGVTMIDTDTVYMYGFAIEQMNEIIDSMVHTLPGKGIWANGPTSIEVCKAMDGIMSEATYQALYQQYLGITRPMILLPSDVANWISREKPAGTEKKLKTALHTGHFPSIIQWPDTTDTTHLTRCLALEQRYRPLFDLYRGKQWVLYPRSLQLCEGVRGNIFSIESNGQTDERDYLIPLVSDDKSQLIPEFDALPDPFYYDIWAEVNTPDVNDIEYCYLLSGDVAGVQEFGLDFSGAELHINAPAHRVSSLIHLAREPRYKVTRLSMPVQVRGYPNSFEVNVFNLSDTTEEYKIKLLTPASWCPNKEFRVRLQPHKSKTLKVDYTIPDDHALGEDSTTQVYFREPYVDSVYLPTWVVDEVTFQVPELLFVKFEDGDTFPCCLVNNMPYQVQVNLAGGFVTGSGSVYFLGPNEPFQAVYLDLDSLGREDFLVVVEPAAETTGDTITLSAIVTDVEDTITIRRPVETALFHQEGDLFWDDFSAGIDKWDIKFGNWDIVNESFKGSGPCHYATAAGSVTIFNDFIYQVNTKIEGSEIVDNLSSYMFFRVNDEYNLYRFGIRTDWGGVNFYRRVDTVWTRMGDYYADIHQNKWYNIRVEAKGDSIKAFLDGIEVISIVDTMFSSGEIGIGVWEDYMTTYYDDVIVRFLE